MDWMQNLDNGRTGKRIIFVISSVSGGGKTTVVNRLLEDVDGLRLSVSHTTRRPRKSETDGREYHFVSRGVFEKMIEKDGFLEWASVYDHYYGTSRQAVKDALSDGDDVVLDIDVQGAMQIREERPDAVLIFIIPPDGREQERRLRDRGTETDDQVHRRLQAAIDELALVPEYDYAVVNDEVESAVDAVTSIIVSQRCRPRKVPAEN